MVRVKRSLAGLCALSAALLGLAACKNSIDLVAAVKQEVMKSNDKFLVVKSVDIPLADDRFSPTGIISIQLDRAVNMSSVTAANISIKVDGGSAIPAESLVLTALDAGKKLQISVTPYLDTETNYILTISNLVGADGSGIIEPITRAFTTGLIAAGAITELAGASAESQPGYSITDSIKLEVKINDAYTLVKYKVYIDDATVEAYDSGWQNSSLTSGVIKNDLSGLAAGTRSIRVQFFGKDSGPTYTGNEATGTITVDLTPPGTPSLTLSVASPTNDTTPAWSWTPGAGGAGVFQYQLDSDEGPWTATSALGYEVPAASALGNGEHVLYLRERDTAGHWSASVSASVVIDTAAPAAPLVTGIPATGNPKPTWNWTSGGGEGAGAYRYQLDLQDAEGWNAAAAATFTPASDLSSASHTLYVQERDLAGNWSVSGSFATLVDTTPPAAPIVSGPQKTNDLTPTWSWSPGIGDGNGQYRYQLNGQAAGSWTETGETSYTPSGNLANPSIDTLYVQERDQYGNWSASGSAAVDISSAYVAPTVTLNGPALTTSKSPTWGWADVEGGSNSFQYRINSGAWTATTATALTTFTAPDDGTYTLEVQAMTGAGWSMSGSSTVTIDSTPPNAPAFNAATTTATPSNDPTPTWTWGSGGGGGSGWYQYSLDSGSWSAETQDTSYTPAADLPAGLHEFSVMERDSLGNWSAPADSAIEVDLTKPNAPTVSGAAYTNDTTPTWTWATGGNGGSGLFRYQPGAQAEGAWTETTDLSYTPAALTAGLAYTLYVQERDAAGNWSASGSFAINVDTTPPITAPTVNGSTVTNDTTPYWSWTNAGSGGNGTYRWQLDGTAGAWSTPQAVSGVTWTTVLSEGAHILYVQERDAAGNWSASGSFTTTVDLTPPDPPLLNLSQTTATPTNDATPTWSWLTGGGGGNGTFRYQLDGTGGDWSEPAATASFTPTVNLPEGTHTLYVQECDDAGNWATDSYGAFPIVIDLTPPTAPTVTSPLALTNNSRPTWSWTAGSGGNGNYQYRLGSGAWIPTTALSFTPTAILSSGSYTLYVQVRDDAGNWSPVGTAPGDGFCTLVVDTVLPTVSLTALGTVYNTCTPTATVTDANGIASVYFYYGATAGTITNLIGAGTASGSTYTCAWTVNALPDAAYYWKAVATDNAGNVTTATAVAPVVIDNFLNVSFAPAFADKGTYTSLCVDPVTATTLYLSYIDASGAMKVQRSLDSGTSWTAMTSIETLGTVVACSMTTGTVTGNLYAVYKWNTNNKTIYYSSVIFAKSTDGGSTWTEYAIEASVLGSAMFDNPSIAVYGSQDIDIVIAYEAYVSATVQAIKVAYSTNTGASFAKITHATGAIYKNPAVIAFSAYAHLAYYDQTNNGLKYTRSSNYGATWDAVQQIVPAGAGGKFPSLALRALSSYRYLSLSYIAADGTSIYSTQNLIEGAYNSWHTTALVDAEGGTAKTATDWNGVPPYRRAIAYWDSDYGDYGGLRVACAYNNLNSWISYPIDLYGAANTLGTHASVAVSGANVYIAYYDSVNVKLKFAKVTFRF